MENQAQSVEINTTSKSDVVAIRFTHNSDFTYESVISFAKQFPTYQTRGHGQEEKHGVVFQLVSYDIATVALKMWQLVEDWDESTLKINKEVATKEILIDCRDKLPKDMPPTEVQVSEKVDEEPDWAIDSPGIVVGTLVSQDLVSQNLVTQDNAVEYFQRETTSSGFQPQNRQVVTHDEMETVPQTFNELVNEHLEEEIIEVAKPTTVPPITDTDTETLLQVDTIATETTIENAMNMEGVGTHETTSTDVVDLTEPTAFNLKKVSGVSAAIPEVSVPLTESIIEVALDKVDEVKLSTETVPISSVLEQATGDTLIEQEIQPQIEVSGFEHSAQQRVVIPQVKESQLEEPQLEEPQLEETQDLDIHPDAFSQAITTQAVQPQQIVNEQSIEPLTKPVEVPPLELSETFDANDFAMFSTEASQSVIAPIQAEAQPVVKFPEVHSQDDSEVLEQNQFDASKASTDRYSLSEAVKDFDYAEITIGRFPGTGREVYRGGARASSTEAIQTVQPVQSEIDIGIGELPAGQLTALGSEVADSAQSSTEENVETKNDTLGLTTVVEESENTPIWRKLLGGKN